MDLPPALFPLRGAAACGRVIDAWQIFFLIPLCPLSGCARPQLSRQHPASGWQLGTPPKVKA